LRSYWSFLDCVKRNHKFAYFWEWNDFHSWVILVFLCCFCSIVCDAKTRNNTMTAFSQERKPVFCTTDDAFAPKACRIGSFSSPNCTFVTLLSYYPYFSHFPSVLICLFLWGRRPSSRASRRYAKSSRIYRNLWISHSFVKLTSRIFLIFM